MKKITFVIMLLCMISTTYAKRYYVQLGSASPLAPTWSITPATGDSIIDLTDKARSLRSWLSFAAVLSANDEVWFAGGTYISDISTGRMFTIKNGVKYYGGFAGTETSVSGRAKGANPWDLNNATILDGNTSFTYALQGCCLNPGGATLTDTVFFDGFTVQNFKRVMTSASGGGALWVKEWTVIQNCKFLNNLTSATGTVSNGGGVFLLANNGLSVNSTSQILDCYFSGNVCDKSGGTSGQMYCGVGVVQGVHTIKGCTFESNSTTGYAGALVINQSAAYTVGGSTIENCIFKSNSTSGGSGGALYYGQANATSPVNTETIKNCQFISNTISTAAGTAIQLQGGTKSKLDIQGCTFIANSSAVSGGIALNIASTTIQTLAPVKNCIFRDNTASATGTGEGVALVTAFPATTVYNCVFANNGGGASAVYLNSNNSKIYNSTFANNAGIGLKFGAATTGNEAQNNIFWNNTDNTITAGTTPTLDYNAYSGATGADAGTHSITTLTASPNNTFVSPTSYVGADYATKKAESDAANWALYATCSAVDAGLDLSATITTAINGTVRPDGPMDMGAYETHFSTDIIKTGKTALIKTTANGLSICGVQAGKAITVYTVSGAIIANEIVRSNETNISLQKGLYIVRCDNNISKVVVR